MPKAEKITASVPAAEAVTGPVALRTDAIVTVADVPPRVALAARVAAAAEAAIVERDPAGVALHALDGRLQEILGTLPAAIESTSGDLRDDIVALRDLLI